MMTVGARRAISQAGQIFAALRALLTVLGLFPLAMVILMIIYAIVVEGDRFTDTGPNIGLGLLVLAVMINLPVWLLWLLPPYPWWPRRGGRDGAAGGD